jgi:hypothetical protein
MNAKRAAQSRNSLQILAPPSLTQAIKKAAEREMTTASEYSRRALIARLRAGGFDPANFSPARQDACAA